MQYELWGLHPANLIDIFDSEAGALDEVRGLLDAGWSADNLSLGRSDGTGEIFEGIALERRARSADPHRKPLSA